MVSSFSFYRTYRRSGLNDLNYYRMVAGDSSRVCVGGGGIVAAPHLGYTRKITKEACGDFAGN